MKGQNIDVSSKRDLITVFNLVGATLHVIDGTTIDLDSRHQLFYLLVSTSMIPVTQ